MCWQKSNWSWKLKEYKGWDGIGIEVGESVWICANADPPWFLNADPPDFSPKEGERLPFFAFIRNKWWDGPVRCAIPKICNSSCKFANITAFYTSLQPCQEEAQHRKRQIFDGFCDIWQILRTSRDFSSQAYWPSDDHSQRAVSLEISLLAPLLTFNFSQIHMVSSNGSLLLCFLYSLSSHFLLCFASLAVPMFLLFYDGKLVWFIKFIEHSFFSSKIVKSA